MAKLSSCILVSERLIPLRDGASYKHTVTYLQRSEDNFQDFLQHMGLGV